MTAYMAPLFSLLLNVLEEGFIYAILAMGVYITYKILDFPDLSVDGTFPLGACVTGALIMAGVDPWAACAIAFACGVAAGCVTGLLHVKLGITDLLSGIIVMTAMWSVNLVILGKKAVLAFYNEETIFSGIHGLLPEALRRHYKLLLIFAVALLVKLALDFFFRTKSGLLLRATGDNNQFVITSLAEDPGSMKIIGLALGNGCAALAGCVLAQQAGSASVSSGTGMVIQALASVIIGTSVLRRLTFLRPTTMVIIGAIVYKAFLAVAMQMKLPTEYLKLLMALLFTAVLVFNRYASAERRVRFDYDK